MNYYKKRGRAHENPNTQEFLKNTQALRVINGTCMDTVKGNCRGKKRSSSMTQEELVKESQPLKKRKRFRNGKGSTSSTET